MLAARSINVVKSAGTYRHCKHRSLLSSMRSQMFISNTRNANVDVSELPHRAMLRRESGRSQRRNRGRSLCLVEVRSGSQEACYSFTKPKVRKEFVDCLERFEMASRTDLTGKS